MVGNVRDFRTATTMQLKTIQTIEKEWTETNKNWIFLYFSRRTFQCATRRMGANYLHALKKVNKHTHIYLYLYFYRLNTLTATALLITINVNVRSTCSMTFFLFSLLSFALFSLRLAPHAHVHMHTWHTDRHTKWLKLTIICMRWVVMMVVHRLIRSRNMIHSWINGPLSIVWQHGVVRSVRPFWNALIWNVDWCRQRTYDIWLAFRSSQAPWIQIQRPPAVIHPQQHRHCRRRSQHSDYFSYFVVKQQPVCFFFVLTIEKQCCWGVRFVCHGWTIDGQSHHAYHIINICITLANSTLLLTHTHTQTHKFFSIIFANV